MFLERVRPSIRAITDFKVSFDELKRKSREKCIPKKEHVLELIQNENVIEFIEVIEIKVEQLEIIKTIFPTIPETNTFKHTELSRSRKTPGNLDLAARGDTSNLPESFTFFDGNFNTRTDVDNF